MTVRRRQLLSGRTPAPAAGGDVAYTPSQVQAFKLISWRLTLTTSATAATRQPAFTLTDPNGDVVFALGPSAGQAASTVDSYQAATLFGMPEVASGGDHVLNCVGWPDLWLPPGWKIGTNTGNLDAGDQWSAGMFAGQFGPPRFDIDQELREMRDAVDALVAAAG